MNRRHGIVQMGQVPGASLKHRQRMLIIRIRVGNGDITQFLSLGGKLHRSRQLRCDVHDLNEAAAALLQLPKRCKIRVLQVSAVLRALFFSLKNGPSIWMPRRAAQPAGASSTRVRAVANALASVSYGSVIEAGANDVMPFLAR